MDTPKKHPGGRPTKLTPDESNRIILAVKAGNYIETAAAFGGISKETLFTWLRRGRRSRQKNNIYKQFSDAVEKALADAEIRDVANIEIASKDDWHASAWRLERKYPEKWGRRRVEVTGDDGGPIRTINQISDVVIYIPDNNRENNGFENNQNKEKQ